MTYQKHHQDCDCCGGIKAITPLETINRPGLDQIQYRIGTHPTFFETMKARLSTRYIEQPFQSITSWELIADDVRDLPRFVRRLQKGGDPISSFLRNALKSEATTDCNKKKETEAVELKEQNPDETQPDESQQDKSTPKPNQQEIYCWVKTYEGTAVDDAHRDSLLQYLNEILTNELGFHAANQISHLEISPMLRSLLNETSKPILQINRLILDIAYPGLIIPKLRLYPLNTLTTRQVNDPSIAMLDAWSTVADVLTFYQERFANEGYLPTATERRSILELANLVGYKLRPGVSASTFLAFDVEKGHELIIPKGTRAQSIPGPGELPQAFETSEDFYAKDVWSNMKPRTTDPQLLNENRSTIYLSGIHNNLKPNSPLLIVPVTKGNEQAFFRSLKSLKVDLANQETILTLSGELELAKLRILQKRKVFPINVNKFEERIEPGRVERDSVSPNIGGAISVSWFLLNDDEFSGSVSYNVKILGINSDGSLGSIIDEFDNMEFNEIEPSQTAQFSMVSHKVRADTQYYIAIDAIDHLNTSRSRSNLKGRGVRGEPDFQPIETSYVVEQLEMRDKNRNVSISPTFYRQSIFPDIPKDNIDSIDLIIKNDQNKFVDIVSSIPVGSETYDFPDNLKYGATYRILITYTYQELVDGNSVDITDSNNWDFSTTIGTVNTSEIPKFIWSSNNAYQYLYITRNLKPTKTESFLWDLTTEKDLNPINTGALIKFDISKFNDNFQPKVPILDSKGRYFWKLSNDDIESIPIPVDDLVNGDWLFFDVNDETLNISPLNNELTSTIPINFNWTKLTDMQYEIEIKEFNNGEYTPENLAVEQPITVTALPYKLDDANLKNGTRYRWRIKTVKDETDKDNSVEYSPWWEFTTIGAPFEDKYRVEIINNVLGRLYQRIFDHFNTSAPDIEPLLPLLENDNATKDLLERLIELQMPALQRDRGLMLSIFSSESDSQIAENNYLKYPDTIYPFEKPAQWVVDLEKVLVEIEEQLQLIPIRSSLDDLPFTNLKLKLSKVDELETYVASIMESPVWALVGDPEKEKFLNGDPPNNGEEQDDSYPNGLLDLINDLKVEEPSETRKKEEDVQKITKIEGQIRRIGDFRTAVFAIECAHEADCDPQTTKSTEELTPLTGWLDNLLALLGEFTEPPTLDDEDEGFNENQSLLNQLQKPPSVQILKRSLDTVVSDKKSNFATQLLTTFVPKLKGIYYKALLAKELSLDLERQGVYLFKTKAALFAANSPESRVAYEEDGIDKTITFIPNLIGDIVMELDSNEILLDGEYKEILQKEDSWIVIEQLREGGSSHRVSYKVKEVFTQTKPGIGKVTGLVIENPQDINKSWKEEFQLFDNVAMTSLILDDVRKLWRLTVYDKIKERYEFSVTQDEFAELRAIATKTISIDNYRNIVVYAQNEPLPIARQPDERVISGEIVELDSLYDGILPGRSVIISGERSDIQDTKGIQASEIGVIARVQEIEVLNDELGFVVDLPYSSLILANELAYSYVRDSVTIHANVIEATHGETRTEILGNGDATQANQTFVLKQKPLTHVAAPTSSGVDSELTVYVNDVAWDETENLVFLDKEERGMMTKIDNEDHASVIFGDGRRGARLPTGVENVRAVYRSGIGKVGNVGAEQISMLATKPLGVKGVINPLAATGGVDRETLRQARKNAPIPLFALDRLVSLKDYEDFTRAFAGVAKAKVAQIDFGDGTLIHLTVALVDDVPFDSSSALYHNMVASLNRFGTLNMPLQVDKRSLSLMIASININIETGYIWEKVETAVRQKILHQFGFDNRELGQDVIKSELVAVIQTIPGVVYADVDLLATISETGEVKPSVASSGTNDDDIVDILQKAIVKLSTVELEDRIGMRGEPQAVDENILPAEIAYFSPNIPDALILKEVRS